MKTAANFIRINALLAAALFSARAEACGPVGTTSQANARSVAATHIAKPAPTTTDRYFDPASQTWVLTQK